MLSASFDYFSTNDYQLDILATPVKSPHKIARNNEESSLYHNGNLINFTDQPLISSVFSKWDQFCLFWDQFCRFAYLIRLGDHFCGRTGLLLEILSKNTEIMTKRKNYNNFKDSIFPSIVTHGSKLCERDGIIKTVCQLILMVIF